MHLNPTIFRALAILLLFSGPTRTFGTGTVQKPELPRIHIIATGGTIAGQGATATSGSYTPGRLSIQTILEAVPQLTEVARISSEQIFSIPSQDLTVADWLQLSRRVNEWLANDSIAGIVVTHGTDVMEETAYFLQLTVNSTKPVVLTGAMRPATSLSADGPLNLFNAVTTAAHPESAGKGVLIVMDGYILWARDAAKTNTVQVETFRSPNTGPLGEIFGGEITYKQISMRKHTTASPFAVGIPEVLPRVAVLYGYTSPAPEPIAALLDNGYAGIVYAGVGNGNIAAEVMPLLAEASRRGIQVVRAARIPTGPVTLEGEVDDEQFGFIVADDLSPHKARILLMLALSRFQDRESLQQLFQEF